VGPARRSRVTRSWLAMGPQVGREPDDIYRLSLAVPCARAQRTPWLHLGRRVVVNPPHTLRSVSGATFVSYVFDTDSSRSVSHATSRVNWQGELEIDLMCFTTRRQPVIFCRSSTEAT
jgi:hypothetical protein